MTQATTSRQSPAGTTTAERKVIFASSLGTVFEWYDFFLYGSLAAVIAKQFFSKVDANTGLIFALLAFAAGYIVRPFGALVFGRLGDVVGRKYTFLATILLMGLSTFAVGLLPGYETLGVAAPVILVLLRLLQGLAMGGEYGGAAVYVAEHAPRGKRGRYTAWIQTTGTVGFMLSLVVVLGSRTATGEAAFADWGWRIPFLASIVLLAVSVWIRLKMHESPVFAKMKAEGSTAKSPLRESFGTWKNVKSVLVALFGVTTGLAVVWYTGQFYALLFLTQTLKIDAVTANTLIVIALVFATPFFVLFGTLSDRIGRRPVVLVGMLIAALAYMPLFKALTHFANPAFERALADSPVVVVADPADCQLQFNPTGTRKFLSSCDVVKAKLVAASVNYTNEAAPPGTPAVVRIGPQTIPSFDARGLPKTDADEKGRALSKALGDAIAAAGYPQKADPAQINRPVVVLLLFLLVLLVTMVYGPAAAILVELFPARVRYSSMSLPYHVGTGWFGGLMPTIAFAMVAWHGDIYAGLWYPITVCIVTAVIGFACLRETRHVDIETGEVHA